MHSKSSSSGSGSIGFVGLLTIVFIVLKLCGVISWNWFWVLSPSIFSLAAILFVLFIIGTMFLTRARKNKRRNK